MLETKVKKTQEHLQCEAISVASSDKQNRIGLVWAAFTLESNTGYTVFESLSPRPIKCKSQVGGGFSMFCFLHQILKA